MPGYDDMVQRDLGHQEDKELEMAIDQAELDGFARLSTAMWEEGQDTVEKMLYLLARDGTQDIFEWFMSVYLEGCFSLFKKFEELEPEAADRMKSWMDLLNAAQEEAAKNEQEEETDNDDFDIGLIA